ncbi:MAG: CHASE domain-containing protein [Chlorobi bacterium]|nr:CHASE domain-containing protein [Chlorobiota bacterium]
MGKYKVDPSTMKTIADQEQKQPRFIMKFSKTYPAFIILAAFIAFSFWVWDLSEKQVYSDQQLEFDKATISIMSRFELQHQTNLHILHSMTGLYDQLVQVVQDYFHLYGSIPTKTYPSIYSLMYAPIVSGNGLDEFIYNARSGGSYDYDVYPKGKRDLYIPIEIVEPMEPNKVMSGFDLGTKPLIKTAIFKSRDSNKVVASSIFTMRQPDVLGFYLVAPAYGMDPDAKTEEPNHTPGNFKGAVIMEVNSELFFAGAMGEGLAGDSSIICQCFEYTETGRDHLLWESNNARQLDHAYHPLTKEMILDISDRSFLIRFSTVPSFGGGFQDIFPILAFTISLIVSVIVFAFLMSVITSRTRAVELAEKITRSQRRIVDSSADIIATLDISGTWKTMNPASKTIFELEPTDMIGTKIDDLFEDEEERAKFYKDMILKSDDHTERDTYQMRTAGNDLKWINWSFSISKAGHQIYCIGRDVTIEKAVEEHGILRNKQIRLSERFTRESSELKSYTMANLNHQIRNSLTGILGSLNLLLQKAYDNDSEHDSYINDTITSSEQLLDFVSSEQMEFQSEKKAYKELAMINVGTMLEDLKPVLKTKCPNTAIKLNMLPVLNETTILGEQKLFHQAVKEMIVAMAVGLKELNLDISVYDIPDKDMTEIKMVSKGNPLLSEMIDIYKNNQDDLVNSLEFDKNDIIFNISGASSNIHILRGTFSADTKGGEGENTIRITLHNKP